MLKKETFDDEEEKKQKAEIVENKAHCLNCKFLSRYSDPLCIGTKSPFYCKLGHQLKGEADFTSLLDSVYSEWKFDDSHENPTT